MTTKQTAITDSLIETLAAQPADCKLTSRDIDFSELCSEAGADDSFIPFAKTEFWRLIDKMEESK